MVLGTFGLICIIVIAIGFLMMSIMANFGPDMKPDEGLGVAIAKTLAMTTASTFCMVFLVVVAKAMTIS